MGRLKEIFKVADIAAKPRRAYRIFTVDKYREGFFQSIMLFESPNSAVKYTEQVISITQMRKLSHTKIKLIDQGHIPSVG